MKKLLILAIIVLQTLKSEGQLNYTFAATAGTYTAITGTSPTLTGTADEGYADGISIGFTFRYNGIDYTTLGVSTNGFVSLGLIQYLYSSASNNLTTSDYTYTRPIIAPLWDDLHIQTGTNLKYSTTGAAGSRVFTMQWQLVKWSYNASAAAISFQLKLSETSNLIQFIYKQEAGTTFSPSASIGITAIENGVNNFMSVQGTTSGATVSNQTENASISTRPATGQIFRFTPVSCLTPTNLQRTNFAATSASFNWTAVAGASSYNWEIRTAGNPGTAGAVATGNTTNTAIVANSLTPATAYTFHVQSNCGSGLSIWNSQSFFTNCNSTGLPYSETFDAAAPPTVPVCINVQNVNNDVNTWQSSSDAVAGMSGNQMRYVYNRNNAADDWLFTRGLNLTAGVNYAITFKYAGDFYPEKLQVKVGSSPSAAAMTSAQLYNNTNITGFGEGGGSFTPSSSGVYYFGFHVYSQPYQYILYLDDIQVEVAPPPPACTSNIFPSNGETNINSPVTLSWNAVANAISYDVFLSTDGFSYTLNKNVTGTSTPITTSPNTTYYWYVRPRTLSTAASGCQANATNFTTSLTCDPVLSPQLFGQAPPSPTRAWIYCRGNPIGFGVLNSALPQVYNFSLFKKGIELERKGGPLDGNGGQLSVSAAMRSVDDAGEYRITTFNECGQSSSAGFQAFYGNIDNLTITNWGNNAVSFKWAASGPTPAVTYEYAVTTIADSNSTQIPYLLTTDTTATVTGLTNNSTYYIHIRVKSVVWNGANVSKSDFGCSGDLPWQTLRFVACSGAAATGSISPATAVGCTGSGTTLTASGGTTYAWYRENNSLIAGASGNTYTATADGNYKVYITTASACQGMVQSANVKLISAVAGIFSGGGNFFSGDTVALGISKTLIGQTYTIKKDGAAVYTLEGIGKAVFESEDTVWYKFAITSPTQAGNYTVTVSNGYCQPIIFGSVNVALTNKAIVCPAGTITFQLPSAGAGYSYQWEANTGSGFTPIVNNSNYAGATTPALTISNAPTSFYGYEFRRIATGATVITSASRILQLATSWTGAGNTAWNNTANWSCGVLPDANTDVHLPAGLPRYPSVTSNTSCRSVQLTPGATLNVAAGVILTLTGQ